MPVQHYRKNSMDDILLETMRTYLNTVNWKRKCNGRNWGTSVECSATKWWVNGKCSKEDLVERIIRKDQEVSKLISKNKVLNKELFEEEELRHNIKINYEDKVESLNNELDEVIKKNISLQKGLKKTLIGLYIMAVLFVLTLILVFIA